MNKRLYLTLTSMGIFLMILAVAGNLINYYFNGVHAIKAIITSKQLSEATGHHEPGPLKYYIEESPKYWVEISRAACYTNYGTMGLFVFGMVCLGIAAEQEKRNEKKKNK